jgi:hypothetical protein
MVGNRRLITSGRGGAPALLAEAEELRHRLGVEQRRRPVDQEALQNARTAFQEAMLRVRISDPEYADLVQVGTIGLKQLQHEVLTPGTTLVAYFVTGKQVLAWVIDDPWPGRGAILIGPPDAVRFRQPAPPGKHPLMLSGLALAGANRGLKGSRDKDGMDGIHTAYEALSLDLDGTELVVLSACETGLGSIQQGEGVYGLRRAFQEAGAGTVLSTLWKVDDTATTEWMESFYTLLLDKRISAREAVRLSQKKLLDDERWSHPFYWAPFVLVGRGLEHR